MREKTADPNVVIVRRKGDAVFYSSLVSGEKWVIRGTCNHCGECCLGAVVPGIRWTGKPVGEPGAVEELGKFRLDVPTRPEATGSGTKLRHCTLRGEYL